jgi:hypothetical protein
VTSLAEDMRTTARSAASGPSVSCAHGRDAVDERPVWRASLALSAHPSTTVRVRHWAANALALPRLGYYRVAIKDTGSLDDNDLHDRVRSAWLDAILRWVPVAAVDCLRKGDERLAVQETD